MAEKKRGFFGRLAQKIEDVLTFRTTPDEETIDELEDVLISSDIGMQTTMNITDELRARIRSDYLNTSSELRDALKEIITGMLDKKERLALSRETPLIILMIGVNGVGKTTTIAKLARRFQKERKSVLLIAADTFRAAASEQLSVWGERLGVPVIKHKEGADPSAVIFDGLAAAKSRNTDVIICDTAGRLHNKSNLMNELAKMNKVISREYPDAARETLLVLDATTGKNAVSQAKEFGSVADLSGIILTKLDGTAKGGIVITLADELDLPVKFIGVGEGMDDLRVFDPKDFAESIFEG
ncbi:MAG: signal recognition particle-docking protein FtsY [Firmicutes bacterium]|nr:signal recognition particle-docking protein FtsY [Bacillota bacterium]MBQ6260279.1 signal recognition particle-docking protein FtsY [Bacillota bacterium]MBR0441727.1 signal recognition particle-docking protein FtsY [Bacillota bacterium]MBR0522292.1 signal recognition particle-docking protein FtsY [Bacillota bacterium]